MASIPHRHSFYQIIWFKQAGRHYIDYNTVDHDANTIFFINRNQVHHFCLDSANEGYLFHFNDYFINRSKQGFMDRFSLSIFSEIGSSCLVLSDEDAEKIGLLASFIEKEIQTKESFYREQVYHYFQNILFLIERLRKTEGSIDIESNPDHKLAAGFKKLVFEEIQHFHGVDYFAEKLNTNSKKLTEISKSVLLDTPANIIKQSRILEAKRMLSNRSISIKEIAFSLGFDEPTYFTKYFKKGTGFTPKQFQKEHL
ncbi:helix-turn-helix domain-containing protein [Flagellimonas nanhaiensis]|uniref:AraC family transcriptional regulator n=1 Tax=Flagellimonas nanhaiensis TaxID=2292706 RepID=A0A371JV74_9FLAO|nr:AraC family transcriptional regulator [Allomuricauda nanhaiensis]